MHAFTGPPDGGIPFQDELTLGTDGSIYGTTQQGGTSTSCANNIVGCGTIFKYTP